jgi:hypothetical protein
VAIRRTCHYTVHRWFSLEQCHRDAEERVGVPARGVDLPLGPAGAQYVEHEGRLSINTSLKLMLRTGPNLHLSLCPLGDEKELGDENKQCTLYPSLQVQHRLRSCQKGKIAMTQANLRLVEGTFMDKTKALDPALSQIERAIEKGTIMWREKNESTGLAMIEAIEPEAELFVLAEQVDIAEKAFHDALARRNEAQIAYLREPSIMTREVLEAAKTAEAVALEILDTEVRWLASTRATTVIGLKLKASYASTGGKLADSIVEDILQL